MVAIQLNAYVDENGQLTVRVPDDFPRGDVKVTIEQSSVQAEDDLPLTDEEIAALLKPEPKTGAEIVEMLKSMEGWEDYGITDPVDWIEQQRRIDWKRKFGNQTW